MRTSFVAVTLCALLVGTVAAAGAVSAKNNDNTINSSIRQYDVMYYPPDSKTGEVIGKVTIDGETGHYVVNVNFGRADLNLKFLEGHVLWVVLWNDYSFGPDNPDIPMGSGLLLPTFINAGGISHAQYSHELVPQWFNGGAVDQGPTVVNFYCFDCIG